MTRAAVNSSAPIPAGTADNPIAPATARSGEQPVNGPAERRRKTLAARRQVAEGLSVGSATEGAEDTTEPPPPVQAESGWGDTVALLAARLRWHEVEDAIEEADDHLRHNQPEAAIAALHTVLSLANGRQRGRMRLLLAMAYLAEPEQRRCGVALLRQLVQEQPANADALVLLGTLYLREGLLMRAASTLARAIAANPSHVKARARLRAVHRLLQEHVEAQSERTTR